MRFAIVAGIVAVVSGCGLIGYDAATGSGEAVVDATTGSIDAGVDASFGASDASVWERPWSTPVLWEHGGTTFETSPSLTGDGLELFFVSSRNDGFPGNDVFTSLFDGSNWSAPIGVNELAYNGHTQALRVSFDGLTLWSSRTSIDGDLDIWISERTTRSAAWSAPELTDSPDDLGGLNSPANDWPPMLFDDGLRAIFASARASAMGVADLYLASRATPSASWSNVINLAELNTGSEESMPYISSDGRYLVFHSNRQPNNTNSPNDSDFYQCQRISGTGFGPIVKLNELNSPIEFGAGMTWDAGFTANADGTLGFFATNRSGIATLYTVTR